MCGTAMHFFPVRGECKGATCFFKFHSNSYVGLCRSDVKIMGEKRTKWTPPTKVSIRKNKDAMMKLERRRQK